MSNAKQSNRIQLPIQLKTYIGDENGNILNDGPDIRNRWKSFCEDLYRRNNNISSELPDASYENVELEPSPLYSEIEKAIKEIKSN